MAIEPDSPAQRSSSELTAEFADLRRRLQRLEDEVEIRRLLSTYAFSADLGRVDEFAELWTEDGRIEPGAGDESRAGRDALRAFVTAPVHVEQQGHCQHHVLSGPTVVQIDGDNAVVEGYSFVIVVSDEQMRRTRSSRSSGPALNVGHAKFNRWRLSRIDGYWRIRERIGREIGEPGIPALFVPGQGASSPGAMATASQR